MTDLSGSYTQRWWFHERLEYVLMAAVMWRVYNCMSYFMPKGDYVMMYVILCISIHMMPIVLFVCFPVTFSVNGNSISIEVLIGLNFKKWKEDFLFGMELADVHIALTKDKPADITTTSIEAEKTDYAAWEKSNRICLLTMKKSI